MSANLKAFGVQYRPDLKESVIFDRCYRQIVKLRGRWPRVDKNSAVACDIGAPRCYSGERTFFHSGDANNDRCCPVTRQRLAELMRSIPACRDEVNRRTSAAQEAARPIDLVALTFG